MADPTPIPAPSPRDRRVQLISLTAVGRAAELRARAGWDELEEAVTSGFTVRQRADLERLLLRSAGSLEAALADRGEVDDPSS